MRGHATLREGLGEILIVDMVVELASNEDSQIIVSVYIAGVRMLGVQ